jgi:hypothetical protein
VIDYVFETALAASVPTGDRHQSRQLMALVPTNFCRPETLAIMACAATRADNICSAALRNAQLRKPVSPAASTSPASKVLTKP